MNSKETEELIQKMLSIINQIPMGLVETDMEGYITGMNAKSIQLLMPLFHAHKIKGDNINQLLISVAPALLGSVRSFTKPNGNIIKHFRQQILASPDNATGKYLQYIFTVERLGPHGLVYFFDDITDAYNKERELNQIIHEKAIEENKFEIASGVLHDIGNAVIGFGAYITKIKRSVQQNDIPTLENLKIFIEKNQPALQDAIGEKKSNAVADLLSGIVTNQKNSLKDITSSITDQMKILAHIQEILNIQRQYVTGRHQERETVNIRGVINDAAAMLFGSLHKNNITIDSRIPNALPSIKGDRTKLMQVFLNLFKNALEAILSRNDETVPGTIDVIVLNDGKTISIITQDNGIGFGAETSAGLFARGFTTKPEGTGLGLANCKNIVEAHGGQMTLKSDGVGKGASCTVIFHL